MRQQVFVARKPAAAIYLNCAFLQMNVDAAPEKALWAPMKRRAKWIL